MNPFSEARTRTVRLHRPDWVTGKNLIEHDLRIPVAKWLIARGLSPICEVYSLGNCDMVGVRFIEKPRQLIEMVAVELKTRDVAGVLRQCRSHRECVSEVWAAMLVPVALRHAERFREVGVGLMGVDGSGCRIIVPAPIATLARLGRWITPMWRRRKEYVWRMRHPRMYRYPAERMRDLDRKRIELELKEL